MAKIRATSVRNKSRFLKTSLQRLKECKMLKYLRRILEMRATAELYVTTSVTTSLESLGLVCNALVREILAVRRN